MNQTSIAVKPANLEYGLEDRPALHITVLQGLQHICMIFVAFIFPVLIIREVGGTADEGMAFVSLSLVAGAAAVVIQSLRRGPAGSGYLCPSVCGPAYFDASKSAALAGGLPLLFGMTVMAGVMEIAFSQVMHRLRKLFPAEVTGLAVMMVGVVVVPIAIRNFFDLQAGQTIGSANAVIVGVSTLLLMMILNTFVKSSLKLYSTLVGIVFGYLLAFLLGEIPAADWQKIAQADLFALPHMRHLQWRFDFSLVIPFAIATVCSSLKTVGDLVTCQKINDANWRRADMNNVARGIFADGLGGLIPGLIGGYGQSTSSSNVGLSLASGVTSRIVAYAVGGLLFFLAFFPKFSMVFLIMPRPVMGASLIFAVCFMIISGLQIITSRMLDARKIFVVGVSFILGLSVDMVPGLYRNVHPWIKPIFSSSLSLSLITAIFLNLLMRIGIAKRKKLEIAVSPEANGPLLQFMELTGKSWGALQEVIHKSMNALAEFNEAMLLAGREGLTLRIEAAFDEFNIDIEIRHAGAPISVPKERPPDWLKAADEAYAFFAIRLMRSYSDKVTVTQKGDETVYHLHFIH